MRSKAVRWEISSLADDSSDPFVLGFAERYGLTPRETELMRALVLLGLRNEEIGAMFHIAVKTVKNHIACMMGKTRTHSSRELQALFLRYVLHQQANGES